MTGFYKCGPSKVWINGVAFELASAAVVETPLIDIVSGNTVLSLHSAVCQCEHCRHEHARAAVERQKSGDDPNLVIG